MPEYAIWTLIISLTMYSLGVTLKSANLSHRLKLVDKEINSRIEQIKSIEQEHKHSIMSLSELHEAEKQKLSKSFEAGIEKLIHIVSEKYEPKKPKGLLSQ